VGRGENSRRDVSGSMSRRRFLTTTGLALSLSCGGIPTFAQLHKKRNQRSGQESRSPTKFIYGTHFYHPGSGPRPDQFRGMIKDIATKYQFNIIRIFPPWDYYNSEPEKFNFEELEELLRICDEYDIRVLMTIMLESAPYWLEQAHPETRFVNARGEPIRLAGSGAHYTGGYPGLCFDWEVVRNAAELFVHELTKLSASHPSIYAYDIWNEPEHVDLGYQEVADVNSPISGRLFCYCEQTIAKFQGWLERRYGTLDRLNNAWIRAYPNWKAIDPPRKPGNMYADWMDWFHFIQESMTECMRFRAKAVKEMDSSRVLESHVAYFPPVTDVVLSGGQNWRLAEVVDVLGCTFWARDLDQAAAQLDVVRSYASGKDFWITEMEGNHESFGYLRSAPMLPQEIRVRNWLAVFAGAKAIIYWTYLTEGTGVEASGFGLVSRGGESTERAEEAARTNRFIQARWALLEHYRPKPQVAILFDQDNAILTFAGNAKEEPSTQSASGYHNALWNLDHWVDFIEVARINDPQYKVLIVPWHLIGKKATCEAIRSFVEGGGVAILETAFGRFDENYFFNPVIPGYGLDEVFGYREKDSLMIESGKFATIGSAENASTGDLREAELVFSQPIATRVKAHTYLTPIEVHSATPIATCHEWTVAATKKVGNGRAYYFGTNMGGTLSSGDSSAMELLGSIISTEVVPMVSCSGVLRPRLINGAGRGLLGVFNRSDAHQTATIVLAISFKYATDVYSGKRWKIENDRFPVGVAPGDVAVFEME
jgi:beta-galactosidase GanA